MRKRKNYITRYKPLNESKYKGNNIDNIICRSLWERKLAYFLDINDNVDSWSMETHKVKYFFPIDEKIHTYFIDFYIKFKDGKELLVEVKPLNEKEPPKLPKSGRETKSYKYQKLTYARNMCKWQAAMEAARVMGMGFEIWTEIELKQLGLMA